MRLLIFLSSVSITGCFSGPREWQVPWLTDPASFNPINIKTDRAELPQGQYPIDLETTLRLAAKNNLDIALAREALYAAYAKIVQDHERFFPTLGPTYRFWRLEGSTQATLGDFVETDKQNSLLGGGLALRWPLGEAIFTALSSSKNYDATRSALEVTSQNVVQTSAQAYFDLLKEDQRVAILSQAVNISEKLVKETEIALNAGKGFKGDQLRGQAQKTHNQLALLRAKESLRQASIRLVSILRLDPKIELLPADNKALPLKFVDESKIETLLQQAFDRRPEVAEAKKRLEILREDQRSAYWGPFIPELQADATLGQFGPVVGNSKKQNLYQFMLSWKIGPGGFFDFGRQHLVDSKVHMGEIQLARLMQQVEEEVRSSFSKVQSLLEQITLAEQEIADADEALKLNQERQAVGMGLPLEVIQAEEVLTRARLDYLLAVIDYNQAQFQLFVKIGGLAVRK